MQQLSDKERPGNYCRASTYLKENKMEFSSITVTFISPTIVLRTKLVSTIRWGDVEREIEIGEREGKMG
jgi:hypothetical protein